MDIASTLILLNLVTAIIINMYENTMLVISPSDIPPRLTLTKNDIDNSGLNKQNSNNM